MSKKEQLHNCPHCGNYTNLKLEHELDMEEDLYDEFNDYDAFGYNCYYTFRCTSCNRVSIYAYFFYNPVPQVISKLDLLYPKIREVEHFVPKEVRESYNDAQKVKNRSAISFAILIRKSLEQICRNQGAKGGNLTQMIRDLDSRGILPTKLTQLSMLIRNLGNVSAHESYPIDFWDVDLLDELFHFIIDYIYIIDDKIEFIKLKWGIHGIQ